MNPKINIICALSKNRVIGRDNKLPWHISEDLKRFKSLTSGHPIIMGRKTFESIGRPLPNRTNIIITRDPDFKAEGCEITHSLEEAILLAKNKDKEQIFIIGGGQIFEQALPLADKLYLTLVDIETRGDTFFPDYSDFKKVLTSKTSSEGEYTYTFLDLER